MGYGKYNSQEKQLVRKIRSLKNKMWDYRRRYLLLDIEVQELKWRLNDKYKEKV